jgi:hypothetical protein
LALAGCGGSSASRPGQVDDSGGAGQETDAPGATGAPEAGTSAKPGSPDSAAPLQTDGAASPDVSVSSSPDAGGPPSTASPDAFFTDLTSGPATGGQTGKGAFVTVYGNGFGATQGASAVTLGASTADNYPLWSDTKITFQLATTAQTGNIVVHVAGKDASNPLAFTVRAGHIFFVSGAGKDTGDGSYGAPWATIPHAKNSIAAGDIAYVGTSAGDAVSQTTEDASSAYHCALGMSVHDGTNSGTADLPKALVVYPGATGLIGDPSGVEHGILTPAITGTFDYWVIAGFTLRALNEGIDLENTPNGWRIIGNDISCPNGSGLSGCVTGGPTHLAFYGNVVHDAAANVATAHITKYYHGVYWGSSHIDMGWNVVRDGKTCRAIQFHDTGGPNEFDLHVHDNVIHGTVCDGINFATVDPSQGTVEAYNNVIYDVGQGPDPADGSASYVGIYVPGETEMGPTGSGTVEVYGNTLYDCGSWAQSGAGAFSNGGGNMSLTMHLVDNLVVEPGAMEAYIAEDSTAGLITGSNNLFFGAGAVPAVSTASIGSDPLLVDPAHDDFHLTAASPAVGKGIMVAASSDFDGNARSQGGSWDIGAFELVR